MNKKREDTKRSFSYVKLRKHTLTSVTPLVGHRENQQVTSSIPGPARVGPGLNSAAGSVPVGAHARSN